MHNIPRSCGTVKGDFRLRHGEGIRPCVADGAGRRKGGWQEVELARPRAHAMADVRAKGVHMLYRVALDPCRVPQPPSTPATSASLPSCWCALAPRRLLETVLS